MERLKRKQRTEIDLGILSSGGMFDLFDNVFKSAFRINDDEFDYIATNANDEEINCLVVENPSFNQKRKIIEVLDKYLSKK